METLTLQERLLKVQTELKAPKNMYNSFGKYNYRNLEGILEAVKPLLAKYGLNLILSDETFEVAGFPFVNAKAKVFCADYDTSVEVYSQAGLDLNKKGMDAAQSSGSSSSYARKYALNGLFLIDDTKDADDLNTHGKEISYNAIVAEKSRPRLPKSGEKFNKVREYLKGGGNITEVKKKYSISKEVEQLLNQ
jgi:hypothetical protein